MEFKNRLKNIALLFAITLFTALGASACGSSEFVDVANDSANIGTDTGAPVVGEADPVQPPPGGGGGGGGGGGVRPDLSDIVVQGDLVVDDGDDTTPPSGGGSGGGGLDNPPDNCLSAEPFGNRKKNNVTVTGTSDDLVANDCIII